MATSTHVTRDAQSDTCPRCLGSVETTPTETVCGDCGLVLDDSPIDHGPDWGISNDGEASKERAKPGNRNRYDRGLGSSALRYMTTDKDEQRRQTIDKNARNGSAKDRNRDYATSEIQRLAAGLDLPGFVGERAKRLFRDLHAESLEGKNLDILAASCLYAASRMNGQGRTTDEIATVARCDERPIRRRMWWVADELDLEVPPPDLRQRIRVIGQKLPSDSNAIQGALNRLEQLDGADTQSGSPSTLAAALLYQAGEWTQAAVAEAAGVTPTGLRKRRDAL